MNPLLADTPKLRIDRSSAGMLMTPEEFDAIEDYDDKYRYELIRGVLIVNPIASEGEADPNEQLGYWLRAYRDHHAQGASLDLTLPERYVHLAKSRRRADRVIWAGLGRTPDSRVDVPKIVVEFVSKARRDWKRDYIDKRREYAKVGVVEYWVINRFQREMTVFFTADGKRRQQTVSENETYRTKLLPGFELPLGKLLSVADWWRK